MFLRRFFLTLQETRGVKIVVPTTSLELDPRRLYTWTSRSKVKRDVVGSILKYPRSYFIFIFTMINLKIYLILFSVFQQL